MITDSASESRPKLAASCSQGFKASTSFSNERPVPGRRTAADVILIFRTAEQSKSRLTSCIAKGCISLAIGIRIQKLGPGPHRTISGVSEMRLTSPFTN